MAFNPELGSTSPAVLLDNATRLDNLLNSLELAIPDREGVDLDTWRGIMAKVASSIDDIRQNLIPLSKQYQTLAAAQAISQISRWGRPHITAARTIAR